MARDTLIRRIDVMEKQRDATRKGINRITADFTREIYPNEWATEPNINLEWASEAEQIVDGVIAALIASQETSLDGEVIDTKRRAVIQQAKELSECLSEIHTPYSADLEGPDLHLTKDQVAEVTAAGERAEGNLEQCISAVKKSGDELDTAFKFRLERLRARIRQIDVLVMGL